MPIIKNTDRAVEATKALNGRQTEYVISDVKGLRLHVQPSGSRKWFFHYWLRDAGKKKHKAEPIGDAGAMPREEAVRAARALQVRLDRGEDPVATRQAENAKARRGQLFKTFNDMAEAWLAKAVRRKHRTAEDTERRYRRHIQEALGARKPGDINRGDVIVLLEDVQRRIGGDDPERGGYETNRVQHLIHAIYGWAISEGHDLHDPTYRLKYRHKEEPRQRALSAGEIKAIWYGLDLERFKTAPAHKPISPELRDIYRLLILLGQRKMEVARMEKSELELEGDMPVWTIPGSRTKNGVAHRLPLPPLSLKIVREAVDRSGSREYVFPCWQTGRPYTPVGVGEVSRLLRGELELGDDIRVHDFRRTVGTQMASLRISAEDRARVFNHVRGAKTNTTTKVYDVYAYDEEKLRALTTWETKLKALIGYEGATNVISLASARTA